MNLIENLSFIESSDLNTYLDDNLIKIITEIHSYKSEIIVFLTEDSLKQKRLFLVLSFLLINSFSHQKIKSLNNQVILGIVSNNSRLSKLINYIDKYFHDFNRDQEQDLYLSDFHGIRLGRSPSFIGNNLVSAIIDGNHFKNQIDDYLISIFRRIHSRYNGEYHFLNNVFLIKDPNHFNSNIKDLIEIKV